MGAQKLTRENLKVVWAEFSILSTAVFVVNVIVCHRPARLHLEFKI
jgi:hypothetical protein